MTQEQWERFNAAVDVELLRLADGNLKTEEVEAVFADDWFHTVWTDSNGWSSPFVHLSASLKRCQVSRARLTEELMEQLAAYLVVATPATALSGARRIKVLYNLLMFAEYLGAHQIVYVLAWQVRRTDVIWMGQGNLRKLAITIGRRMRVPQ